MLLDFIPGILSFIVGTVKKKMDDKSKAEEANRTLKLEEEITRRETVRLENTRQMEKESRESLLSQLAVQANATTTVSAQRNEESVKVEGNKWNKVLNFIRGTVRPIVTYSYLFFYFALTTFLVFKVYSFITEMPRDMQTIAAMKDFYGVVIDAWFKATISCIIGFWFGSR